MREKEMIEVVQKAVRKTGDNTGVMADLLNQEQAELQKPMIEEMERSCKDCVHYEICSLWTTADLDEDKAYKYCFGRYRPKIPKDAVVMSKEEYDALIAEYKTITYKYDNICDKYRLCKDANETIKQHAAMARKETAEKILKELYEQIDKKTPKWVETQIRMKAKQFGVEVEE